MSTAPALAPPQLGAPISRPGTLAYVKRVSAIRQAEAWNRVLADDPVFGPACGMAVGIGPRNPDTGRYPLIWINPGGQQ